MVSLDHVRQEALWGRQGQQVLAQSSLALVGSGLLLQEIALCALTLGFKNISVVSSYRYGQQQFFLDRPVPKGASQSSDLESLLKEHLDASASIRGVHAPPSVSVLRHLQADVIVDCSNDPSCQELSFRASNISGSDLFVAACDSAEFELDYFSPSQQCSHLPFIEGYAPGSQGVIASHALTGVLVEEIRKCVFKRHRDRFTLKISQEVSRPEEARDGLFFKEVDYRDVIDQDLLLHNRLYVHLLDRSSVSHSVTSALPELSLPEPRILVLGGGSLGNFVTVMLAQASSGHICFVDIDAYKPHNIARQYLAYDSVGQRKALVLSRKLGHMNARISAEGVVGFVGQSLEQRFLDEHRLRPQDAVVASVEWMRQGRYDLILGCFDNFAARKYAAQAAWELGVPYLDAGSGVEPTRGSVLVQLPGKEQSSLAAGFARQQVVVSPERRDERWESYQRSLRSRGLSSESLQAFAMGQGCVNFTPGSVSMGNQVAGALLVNEARKILNPAVYGSDVAVRSVYDSSLSSRFSRRGCE